VALDSWLAQTPAERFRAAHPTIVFSDIDFMDKRLLRYDMNSPATREDAFHIFAVKLTVLKDGKEVEFPRTYKVARAKAPDGTEAWAIMGHTK
jgi:hypothetical protein